MGRHVARRHVSAERVRVVRHDRQRVGLDGGLVRAGPRHAAGGRLLSHARPQGWYARVESRSRIPGSAHSAEGAQGRFVPVLGELLSPIPSRRSLAAAHRLVRQQRRLSLHHPPGAGQLTMDAGDASVELASRRTGLSFQRTRMSADRTLMSVIRTSLSLISFGFTIFTVLGELKETHLGRAGLHAPRNFSLALIWLGVGALVLGMA